MNSILKKENSLDSKIGFNLLPNKTIEIVEEFNGVKKVKSTTIEEFIKIIDESYVESFDSVKKNNKDKILSGTGILPNSDSVSTLKVIQYDNDKRTVYLLRKNRPTTINFEDSLFHNVKMPRLIFKIDFKKNDVTTAKVFATKDKVITKKTKLYKYPLSNVGSNGGICFGNIERPAYKNGISSFSFPDFFLSTRMNFDYYNNANSSGLSVRPFLEELVKADEFDNNFLKTTDITFDEF